MQTFHWLEKEIGNLAEAQELINAFHWFLNVEQVGAIWQVRSGETVIFSADSRENVDAFLYGMALAYKGLEPHLYAKIFGTMSNLPKSELNRPIEIEESEGEE
jgi:hypothetical protein